MSFAKSVAFALLVCSLVLPAQAQVVTGTQGAPNAKSTVDGRMLPNLPGAFGGVIKQSAPESTPYWQPQVAPAPGSPNVLLIITDDVGFGAPSTFGGVIPTPTLDRIANDGLRYTNFHTTALCSPTRAALITGRNHHSVGFGVISEMATGYPGYNSVITKDKATIGEILKQHGYATSWFGKNHNTPSFTTSEAGPFDQWPSGMGFEYFYGFNGGESSQWQPDLVRDHTRVYPYLDKPGYNLTTDMADDAIRHVQQLNAIAPSKPFFVKYAPGGTHAPFHPTPEWIEKFKGQFSMGWNKLREQIFANQKKLGVIPQNAVLTDWPNDLLKNWNDLSADERKLFERQMEVYAAYLAYTDYEIGRVVQTIEDMGKLDNTLVIYISGDNGGSAEGSPIGAPNEVTFFNGMPSPPVVEQLKSYDVWGSDRTYPHMAVGWTWAMNTPFKWTKQVTSYFGGTRNGVAISWPAKIKDKGGIRNQFHHVIDITPTILEATGIPAPEAVNGIPQKPIEGVSMAYTFYKSNSEAASKRTTQYFEMMGLQAIYRDGWFAGTKPFKAPWDATAPVPKDIVKDLVWELYDVRNDWTQSKNLASDYPEKVKELQSVFWGEAEKYQVLPLDGSAATRLIAERPSVTAGRSEFTYTQPLVGIPQATAPSILNKSFTITAEIDVPDGGGEGMLMTAGGRFGGWGFYIVKGKPVFTHNIADVARLRAESSKALTPGKRTIVFDFKSDGGGLGKGGTAMIQIDGVETANVKFPATTPVAFEIGDSFDVGSDTGTSVNDADYNAPFKLTPKLNKISISLRPAG
jgi:arylsulfatase